MTDSNAAEPNNSGTFTFTRTGSTATALTVYYTVGGTATNGTDYNSLTGSVCIPANATSANVQITIKDDTLNEGAESVELSITPNAAYQISGSGSAADSSRNRSTAVCAARRASGRQN